jgi:hypothetical protein
MAKQQQKWRVMRIKSNSAHDYGVFQAPTADAAILKVIEEYQITDPEHRKRLAARPVA